MFSTAKSRELDEGQSRYVDVSKRHYGEDVKFYQTYYCNNISRVDLNIGRMDEVTGQNDIRVCVSLFIMEWFEEQTKH